MKKKISKVSNLQQEIYEIPQQENEIHQQNQISKIQIQDLLSSQQNQFRFLSYWEQVKQKKQATQKKDFLNFSQTENQIKSQEADFNNQQRQSLKNAFRYICRLVFKEAVNYYEVIQKQSFYLKQIHLKQKKQHKKVKSRDQNIEFRYGYLFQQAQQISGERYFKEFLQRLQNTEKIIVLKYMIWFLKTKYLRYINKSINQNKGKRKQMKKNLYLKFKNNVMLPYLHQILKQTQTQFITLTY